MTAKARARQLILFVGEPSCTSTSIAASLSRATDVTPHVIGL